jgi:transcriptional regulator with XRE-family HTH domain
LRINFRVWQSRYTCDLGSSLNRVHYSAIERGEQNITIDTLESICKGLGVRMWEVMKDAGD